MADTPHPLPEQKPVLSRESLAGLQPQRLEESAEQSLALWLAVQLVHLLA
jgi:hypothetical protein